MEKAQEKQMEMCFTNLRIDTNILSKTYGKN